MGKIPLLNSRSEKTFWRYFFLKSFIEKTKLLQQLVGLKLNFTFVVWCYEKANSCNDYLKKKLKVKIKIESSLLFTEVCRPGCFDFSDWTLKSFEGYIFSLTKLAHFSPMFYFYTP